MEKVRITITNDAAAMLGLLVGIVTTNFAATGVVFIANVVLTEAGIGTIEYRATNEHIDKLQRLWTGQGVLKWTYEVL